MLWICQWSDSFTIFRLTSFRYYNPRIRSFDQKLEKNQSSENMILCFYILISLPNHKMKTKFFFILLLKFNRFNSFLIDMKYHFSLWNRHRWFELQLEFSISIKRKHMLSSFTASMWLKSEKYRNSSFFSSSRIYWRFLLIALSIIVSLVQRSRINI